MNVVRYRRKDGGVTEYWYAWKGGPKLDGKPGSPEFVASYNEAVKAKLPPPTGVLLSIIESFRSSEEYLDLADRTRRDYDKLLLVIEREFGDLPLAALDDRRCRGEFKAWRAETGEAVQAASRLCMGRAPRASSMSPSTTGR